ncbi:MAG TPA: hypothetical protein PKD28_04080 [Candidatus Saccharibacteria bacterium]|nr:hypothetical protein [Candidatus Saccharibacteria bacterium]
MGTVDVIALGGTLGAIGINEAIIANGLPGVPVDSGDSNGQYLGIGAEPNSDTSEYALWGTPFVISETQTFKFSYYWSPAGATLVDGTEILPPGTIGMAAQFFVLNGTTDYLATDAVAFAESSLYGTGKPAMV